MEEVTRLERRLQRLQEKLKDLESIHVGNELNFTYWGGWELGYIKGQISVIEDTLDLLGLLVSGELATTVTLAPIDEQEFDNH